jgi:5'-phosphate synthase pdxT subunit
MPGGVSNLQTRLLELTGLAGHLVSRRQKGTPILAICAGMVLAASRPGQHCEDRRLLGLIDLAVDNNRLSGLQRLRAESGDTCEVIFSNAPTARDPGQNVEVIGTSERGEIVAARQDSVFVAAYHRGGDIHRRFVDHCLHHWGVI